MRLRTVSPIENVGCGPGVAGGSVSSPFPAAGSFTAASRSESRISPFADGESASADRLLTVGGTASWRPILGAAQGSQWSVQGIARSSRIVFRDLVVGGTADRSDCGRWVGVGRPFANGGRNRKHLMRKVE